MVFGAAEFVLTDCMMDEYGGWILSSDRIRAPLKGFSPEIGGQACRPQAQKHSPVSDGFGFVGLMSKDEEQEASLLRGAEYPLICIADRYSSLPARATLRSWRNNRKHSSVRLLFGFD